MSIAASIASNRITMLFTSYQGSKALSKAACQQVKAAPHRAVKGKVPSVHLHTYLMLTHPMPTHVAAAENYSLIVSSLDGYMKIPEWSLDVLKQQGNMHGNAR